MMAGRNKQLLITSVLLFLASSAILLLIPVYSAHPIPLLLVAALFWLSLLSGYAVFFALILFTKPYRTKGKWGIIRFFQNGYAVLFDLLWIVSLLSLILFSLWPVLDESFLYATLCIHLFSFHMHSLCNGQVFCQRHEVTTAVQANGSGIKRVRQASVPDSVESEPTANCE